MVREILGGTVLELELPLVGRGGDDRPFARMDAISAKAWSRRIVVVVGGRAVTVIVTGGEPGLLPCSFPCVEYEPRSGPWDLSPSSPQWSTLLGRESLSTVGEWTVLFLRSVESPTIPRGAPVAAIIETAFLWLVQAISYPRGRTLLNAAMGCRGTHTYSAIGPDLRECEASFARGTRLCLPHAINTGRQVIVYTGSLASYPPP